MTKKLLTILLLFGLLLTVQAPVTWAQEGEESVQDEVAQDPPTPTPEVTEEVLQEEEPTEEVTEEPTEEVTEEPTEEVTEEPTEEATPEPTEEATPEPTEEATEEPTEEATEEATEEPTEEPLPEGVEEVPTDAVEVSIGGSEDAAGEIGDAGYPAGQHFNSTVYIQNTTTGDLNYQLTLYNVSTGASTACTYGTCDGTIAGNSGTAVSFGDMGTSLADGKYSVIVDSDAQAVAAVSTISEKYAMGYSANPPGTKVYFPNVVNNHSLALFTSPFYVQNAGTTSITDLYVDFYDLGTSTFERTYGPYTLEAGRSKEFDPTTMSPALNSTYYAVVAYTTSDDDSLTGVVNQMTSVRAQSFSYTGFTTGATELYLPNIMSYYASAKWYTPIVIQNLSDSTAATVVVAYYQFGSSTLVYQTDEITIPANAGVPERIWKRTATTPLNDNVQYSVKITSLDKGSGAQPIVAIVNEQSDGFNQAMTYGAVTRSASTLYGPYMVAYNGTAQWFTPIVVQNVGSGATTATVEYFEFDTTTGVAATRAAYQELSLTGPGVALPSRTWQGLSGIADGKLNASKRYVVKVSASGSVPVVAIVNIQSKTYSSQDYAYSWEAMSVE